MNFRCVLAITAVSVLVSAGPFGLALASHGTWTGTTGVLEPDTKYDTTAYMFDQPNQQAVEKIYFNGFIVHDNPGAASMPGPVFEVQPEGGSILSPVAVNFVAMLGFWRDCNRDGYIGARALPMNYGSFSVYPVAASAVDESVCPRGSPYWHRNAETGDANGYVDEFRLIGGEGPNDGPPVRVCVPPNQNPPTNTGLCFNSPASSYEDPFDVADPDAQVWVDLMFPGGDNRPLSTWSQPRGTFDDSDGTLDYVDLFLQRGPSSALGGLWRDKPNVGGCDDGGPEFMGGPDGTCGLWPLYQAERLVSDREGTDEEPEWLVQTFDTTYEDSGDDNPCNDLYEGEGVANPTGGPSPVERVVIADPQPFLHPNFLVEGSLQGTLTNFYRGTNLQNAEPGRCDPVVYGPDSPESDGHVVPHIRARDYLRFLPDQRYRTLAPFGFDYAPHDYAGVGVRGGAASLVGDGGSYFGTGFYAFQPPWLGSGALTELHATFYADVTSRTFVENPSASVSTALPAGRQDSHLYGAEYCPNIITGPSLVNPVTNWECSITQWENERAKNAGNNQALLARAILGDPYDLRDVDCYDNTITDAAPDAKLGTASCAESHGT